MPNLRKPIAILLSDLHFTLIPPPARQGEKNWLKVQSNYLAEVTITIKYNPSIKYVFIAGDLFNSWNVPHELVNWLMDELLVMQNLYTKVKIFAIPGQHDLPYHNINKMNQSAFQTLLNSGVIQDNIICRNGTLNRIVNLPELKVGFAPWGMRLPDLDTDSNDGFTGNKPHLAVIHKYCWQGDNCYPGAKMEEHVDSHRESLIKNGYNCAVIGDNHKGFLSAEKPYVLNCGTFMRRKTDEIKYKPMFGILYDDTTIKTKHLDISKDIIRGKLDTPEEELNEILEAGDTQEVIDALLKGQDSNINYQEMVYRTVKGLKDRGVSKALIQVLEEAKQR